METKVLELKESRETYLVDSSLWSDLSTEIRPVVLFIAVTRQEVLFVWPIPLPDQDGRHNRWHSSALEAAQTAMECWIRLRPNMDLGAYEVVVATGDLPEPRWPDSTFQELLQIAFKNRFIDSLDHPVIRRLRGEV